MDKIIYVVGFGPGDKQFMTMQAVEIIEQADLIVG
ncbi:MAG: SAM-dependent methyltransferase, partial [Oscillospiraceae bacterium]